MAAPLQSALPSDLQLDGGTILRVTAIDPATGSTVAGVTVANVLFYVTDLTGGQGGGLAVGPFMLVPGPGA